MAEVDGLPSPSLPPLLLALTSSMPLEPRVSVWADKQGHVTEWNKKAAESTHRRIEPLTLVRTAWRGSISR